MRQRGLLIAAAVTLACGPSVGEAKVELEEACGAQGPVRLLDAGIPDGAVWGSTVIGERRVAVWYDDSIEDGSAFGAYLLDACGGNERALDPRVYPLVVDGTAYACDPMTGGIRPLDVTTGETGEVLGEGYDCNPAGRWREHLLLRNLAEGVMGLLSADGLTPTPVPFDPDGVVAEVPGLAAFLSRWGTFGSATEEHSLRVLATQLDERIVLYDVQTRALSEIDGRFAAVLGSRDGTDILLVEEADDEGASATLSLAEVGADAVPGDPIDGGVWPVSGAGWGLLTPEQILLEEDLTPLPRPAFVDDEPTVLRLANDRFFQGRDGTLRAWQGSTGALLLETTCPGETCSVPRYHVASDTIAVSSLVDPTTGEDAVWAFSLDGTPPSEVMRTGPHQSWAMLPGLPLRFMRAPSGVGTPDDLEVITPETGAVQTVVAQIGGRAVAPHLPLPRVPLGTDDAFEYYVREGVDAGLWIVGAPKP